MDLTWPGVTCLAIAVDESTQVGQARRSAQALAASVGLDPTDAARVALVTTELATNVLRHGGGGHLYLTEATGEGLRGVEVCAVDRGPGFDLGRCLVDGYSTAGSAGTGLGAIERQAQVFDCWSDAQGAVAVARLYPGGKAVDLPVAARCVAMRGETVSGDGWHVARRGTQLAVAVVDGLGHGPAAADAALAGLGAFGRDPAGDPGGSIGRMHAAMAGTRGGAAAVARYDAASGALAFCGIGNISATVLDPAGTRGLASHAGIVGAQFRRAQTFDVPDCRGRLLVMHSDGLQSRWNLQAYPGLLRRHPATIAAVLMRDFDRGRDDATVVVARLGG